MTTALDILHTIHQTPDLDTIMEQLSTDIAVDPLANVSNVSDLMKMPKDKIELMVAMWKFHGPRSVSMRKRLRPPTPPPLLSLTTTSSSLSMLSLAPDQKEEVSVPPPPKRARLDAKYATDKEEKTSNLDGLEWIGEPREPPAPLRLQGAMLSYTSVRSLLGGDTLHVGSIVRIQNTPTEVSLAKIEHLYMDDANGGVKRTVVLWLYHRSELATSVTSRHRAALEFPDDGYALSNHQQYLDVLDILGPCLDKTILDQASLFRYCVTKKTLSKVLVV